MGQIAENGENGQDGHILVYFAQKITPILKSQPGE